MSRCAKNIYRDDNAGGISPKKQKFLGLEPSVLSALRRRGIDDERSLTGKERGVSRVELLQPA